MENQAIEIRHRRLLRQHKVLEGIPLLAAEEWVYARPGQPDIGQEPHLNFLAFRGAASEKLHV